LQAASVSGILKTAEENLQQLSQYREEHAQVAELTRRPLDTNSGTASHMTSISIVDPIKTGLSKGQLSSAETSTKRVFERA